MKGLVSTIDIRGHSSVIEPVYIFSKGKPKTVNLISDKRNTCAGTTGFGKASKRLANGDLVSFERKPVPEFSPRDNVWRYYTGKNYSSKDATAYLHPAIMPDILAFDIIRTFSNEFETVLDIMAGSGTSCVMAQTLNRAYVGIEISSEYCSIIEERLKYKYDVAELMRKSSEQYNSRFPKKVKE